MSERLQSFLESDLLRLVLDGEKLLVSAGGGFSDYSFVVFPYAKAYEGFLKKLFFKTGAINEFQFKNERWRVGRALNPQLEKDLRHEESAYDRIVEFCGGPLIADQLWEAWKKARNGMFHYYPGKYRPTTIEEAKEGVALIMQAMEKALEDCKIKNYE